MGVNDFVNIIIYSDNKEFSKFRYIFVSEKIRLVLQTNDIAKIRSYIGLYKKSIVILDDDLLSDNESIIFNYLKMHKIGGIVFSKRNSNITRFYKYSHIEHLYIGEYIDFEDVIVALSKKSRIISDNIYNNIEKNYTNAKINNNAVNILKKKSGQTKQPVPLRYDSSKNKSFSKIVVIGASTGGPDNILKILKGMPFEFKYPILIVQHMPTIFTRMFANRINKEVDITVIEPVDGQQILGGTAYIAPGGKQMTIRKQKENYFIKISDADKNNANNPSVDVMFNSVADLFGSEIVSIILTGMGKDGANGMLKIKNQGGYTIGQDENSCVVYGMPKAAYDIGAVQKQLDIDEISSAIIYALNKR